MFAKVRSALVGRRRADEIALLRRELERLEDDNARLRLDRQRPIHLLGVAKKARSLAEQAAQDQPDDDDIEQRHTELLTVRTSLLVVLQELQISAGQLERRLHLEVPASEIDRRFPIGRHARRNIAAVPAVEESPRLSPVPDEIEEEATA